MTPPCKPSPRLLVWLGCCLVLMSPLGAGAQTADLFEFFAEEAQVVTASRIPQAAHQAPATIYALTGEDLAHSGASTLWDMLRSVPGLDVVTFRTFHGTVSIRGLNKSLNSRTLVLVDGRSSMAASVDYSFWENLPVLLEEVERIEVVEGPASALYGANALNGVINIVTKKPGQLGGGRISYGAGERQTRNASLIYGRQLGKMGYKFGLGWRTGNSFEDAGHRASQTLKGTGYLSYDLGQHTQLSLSGGWTLLDTEVAGALFNRVDTDGTVGYLQVAGARRNTRLRCYWNRAEMHLDFTAYGRKTTEHQEVFDLNVEELLTLSARSTAVVGAELRHTSVSSSYATADQELRSIFAEHQWHPAPRWTLWTGVRLDSKPPLEPAFSPRFSLIFTPTSAQTLRLSAGAAYRNPNVLDNSLSFVDTLQIGNLEVAVVTTGNPDLKPERARSLELAHQYAAGRFKTKIAGFGYQLENLITTAASGTTGATLKDVSVRVTYINKNQVKAWGGEAGVEVPLGRQTTGFANYAYQDLNGAMDPQAAGRGTPHHKINGGLRWRAGQLRATAACNWVSATLWLNNNLLAPSYQEVPGYTLATLHLSYSFAGRWQGLELSLDAFNLFDNQHYQTLPSAGILAPGQSAEIIRARRTVNVTYRF